MEQDASSGVNSALQGRNNYRVQTAENYWDLLGIEIFIVDIHKTQNFIEVVNRPLQHDVGVVKAIFHCGRFPRAGGATFENLLRRAWRVS